MQQRIDVTKVTPAAYKAVAALQAYVDQSGLDAKLRELIKIRASQINGCAYCLAMHTRDARKIGETDERMHLLDAWREAPVFSARERAALAWT
jgi:AhpD family alkylhydroperoxidase